MGIGKGKQPPHTVCEGEENEDMGIGRAKTTHSHCV